MMMNRTKIQSSICTIILSFCLTIPLKAQRSNVGNWLIYIGNKKLDSSWNVHSEIQYRNYNAIGDLEQLLLRTGLGYTFNNGKNNALIGYGYIHSENYLDNSELSISVKEHRIFQQFTAVSFIGIVKLQHRYRIEQRFVEQDFKQRFRYFLSLNIPVFTKIEQSIYLSAYNEIFVKTEASVFDRNRLYGGVGYKINKNIKVEIGYMNQFYETRNRSQLNLFTFLNF